VSNFGISSGLIIGFYYFVIRRLLMQYYGVDAIVRIVSHLMFIYISFWALQSLRIEQFFKTQFTPQIRMLMVFFAIAIGYTVSSFALELIALCRNLFIVYFP